ncbi:hypothetical protein ACVV4J_26420 [Escherichia coli]
MVGDFYIILGCCFLWLLFNSICITLPVSLQPVVDVTAQGLWEVVRVFAGAL